MNIIDSINYKCRCIPKVRSGEDGYELMTGSNEKINE